MNKKSNPDNKPNESFYEDFKGKTKYLDEENEEYFPLEDSKPPHY